MPTMKRTEQKYLSYQLVFMSDSDSKVGKNSIYLLAIATVKRDLFGLAQSSKSYTTHKRVLDEVVVNANGIDRLSVMADLGIEHEVVLRDGYSQTHPWGRLHYFYVKVVATETIALGVAALLGLLFRQEAIGITHPLSEDAHQGSRSNSSSSHFHPYFIVHLANPTSHDTAMKIMEYVCQCFPQLSAQLSASGKSIEFHDFSSSSNLTHEDIEKILKTHFDQKFVVETGFVKSSLINRRDYQQALHRMNIEMNRTVEWPELISKHKVNF